MSDVNVGVTRCTDGTVKLETDAATFVMTPEQARKLSQLLAEAGVEPMTTKEAIRFTLVMIAVVGGCIVFATIMASIGR